MNLFKDYASYYDLLYKDKDYQKEANYVISLIGSSLPTAESILNLGCGTGKHDYIFAEKGYNVTGIDLSKEMVEMARKGIESLELKGDLEFFEGDIRSLRLPKKYDVVLSLFHVVSYQTSNQDLLKALETAFLHLKPGGIFIFDCWYGPAVLSDPPVVRVKFLEDEHLEIKRIAEPVHHPNQNVIDVNYLLIIKNKRTTDYSEVKEKHPMRYFFIPELMMFFEKTNFKLVECKEWMTGKEPGINSWNVSFIIKK